MVLYNTVQEHTLEKKKVEVVMRHVELLLYRGEKKQNLHYCIALRLLHHISELYSNGEAKGLEKLD